MLKNRDDIIKFIQNDKFMMKALKTAKEACLPNWFIGAGFVRDTVWNVQHSFKVDYNFKDLDLGYFDKQNVSEKKDKVLEV